MASRWQWSLGKVRRYLAELQQYGALELVKSGRNNILRIASDYLAEDEYDSKAERLARWKEQVIKVTEGEEALAIEQYVMYWSSYSNITKLYKFETTPGYDIISTWERWKAKRKDLQTTNNNKNNGRNKEHDASSDSKSDAEQPITIGECEAYTSASTKSASEQAEPK